MTVVTAYFGVMAFSRCLKQDVDLAIKAEVPGVVMELPLVSILSNTDTASQKTAL
ncbi:MAG: hypothetical protein QXL79_06060 [Sulfolobales archaeon]